MPKPKTLAKNVFAALIFGLLLYLVDLGELWRALSQLTWLAVIELLLISVGLIYISALKWKLFLGALSEQVSVVRLFNLYLVGYFFNLLLPSYIMGDAVRSYYIGKKVGQHQALTATILERYTGLVAMIMLGLIFMWFTGLVTWQIKLGIFAVALALACVTILALSERALRAISRIKALESVVRHLEKIQAGFQLAKRNKLLIAQTMALSFAYHSLTVVNTMVAAHAVGWADPPPWELFVVLPLILLVGAIPVAPSGLGIQEGSFFYFLQGVGASPAQALGVALVLRAKSYLIALIGGLIWLTIKGTAASGQSLGGVKAFSSLDSSDPRIH
jgi:glycosyltransferase 2 family protein